MSAPHVHEPSSHDENAMSHDDQHAGHAGHGWMMVLCCIPMLLIAVVLVATGVASSGFLLVAIGCTAMMVLMMRAMSSPDDPKR